MDNTEVGQEATADVVEGNQALSLFEDTTPATEAVENPDVAQQEVVEDGGQVVEPEQTKAVAEAASPNTSSLTPQEIATLASQTALQTQQAQLQAQQQAAQGNQGVFTDEQLAAAQAAQFSLDEGLFNQIFDSENKADSIAALNAAFQGVAKQAFTMSQIQHQQMMDERFNQFDQRIQPHINFAQQQQDAVMAQQFFKDHPDLVGMDSVVDQVTAQMRQEGNQYPDHKTLFSEVAKRTQAIIQTISGQQAQQASQVAGVQGQAQPTNAVTPQNIQKPTMASVGVGGTGGAGGGQMASAENVTTAKRLFS